MSRYDEFEDEVKERVGALAKKSWKAYRTEVLQDAEAFLAKSAVDLERWSRLLAKGDLSRKDFAWLLQGKKDLAELEALTQAGLSQIRLEKFRTALLDVVVDSAIGVFL